MFRHLAGELPGDGFHACFGRCIRGAGDTRIAAARKRADVNDRASTACDHAWGDCTHRMKHPTQVDLKHFQPFLRACFPSRPAPALLILWGYCCSVDQKLELSVLICINLDCTLHFGVSNRARNAAVRSSKLSQLVLCALQLLFIDIEYASLSSSPSKMSGYFKADTACASCHQRSLSANPVSFSMSCGSRCADILGCQLRLKRGKG